jgi:putative endonuclease
MRIRQQRGRDGESIAVAFLRQQGYEIVACNWRPHRAGLRGELDVIAWHGAGRERFLCFIEVKTRSSEDLGAPQEAVNSIKQRQICALAQAYVSLNRLGEVACRFDVVEVWLLPEEKLPRVALHANAFEFIG